MLDTVGTEVSHTGLILALIIGAGALLAVPPPIRLPPRGENPGRTPSPTSQGRRWVTIGVLTGAGLLLLDPGLWWLSLLISGVLTAAVRHRGPGRTTVTRTADRQLIAVYCELLASCLDAGMALAGALSAVSDALKAFDPRSASAGSSALLDAALLDAAGRDAGRADTGSVGRQAGPIDLLESVAAMLRLGADPSTAWRMAEDNQDLAPIAVAACRSATGGGALSQALREHASELRQRTAAADLQSAARAGVLMTAPLGLCFLPAFLCLGLAPVVVGLLGQLDMF